MCERLHVLPEKGGLFDQDAQLVTGMMIVLDMQAQVEKDKTPKT